MRDIMNSLAVRRAIDPAVVTDNTAQVSQIIDTQGFDSLAFVIALGTIADADMTAAVLVEAGEAANLSDAVAVPDEELNGTEALAGFTFADDNKTRKIGYVGGKRYVRMTITPANNTGNLPISALALLGNASVQPLANPTP